MVLSKNISKKNQILVGVTLILIASGVSHLFDNIIGYRAVALILLFAVSILAVRFEILPVLISAFLSALILNFFFIPPLYTLHIETAEDILLFFMYLFIAMINAVLTVKLRQFEHKKRDEEEKEKTILLYNTVLNSLSHELRTPIATIIGAINTISENHEKLSAKNESDLYHEIEDAGFRLNRQVENLLNMSRLDANMMKPAYDWFDLDELVFKVINEIRDLAEQQRVKYTFTGKSLIIFTDGGLLEMIIYNLVHNALQHNKKETEIEIKARDENDLLVLDISDNGKGFPPGEIPLVFDKFYKLNGTATGGTGLGLSIVRGFTEALNGKIVLKQSKTGGAHFHIEIPAKTSTIGLEHEES